MDCVAFSESKHFYLGELMKSVESFARLTSASLFPKAVAECHVFSGKSFLLQDLPREHPCDSNLSSANKALVLSI